MKEKVLIFLFEIIFGLIFAILFESIGAPHWAAIIGALIIIVIRDNQ